MIHRTFSHNPRMRGESHHPSCTKSHKSPECSLWKAGHRDEPVFCLITWVGRSYNTLSTNQQSLEKKGFSFDILRPQVNREGHNLGDAQVFGLQFQLLQSRYQEHSV